ncbi:AraC-like DNA-binding protein [Kibdelosporangium banguiense]|uniref:AraC-like DNA-binding protein n=1 Tax=Kibdelosporangium banguiense TaxID=1365924 RepID=A0ABS4U2M1_9PSEU|nr:AraC family transcriptional regulator [Kibdelosporangium banguiense]MBP2330440.1 AraC-like DNA-binding protein [Kibdelosporangium banguiense]
MPVADYPAGAWLRPRVIDDFEFVWMLRGRAVFHTARSDITLTPDVLLLVPPGVEHSFVWDPRRPSRHGYIHFRRDGLARDVQTRPMRDPLKGLCAYLIAEDRAVEDTVDFMLKVVSLGPPDEPGPLLGPALRAAIGYLRRYWAQMPLRRVSVTQLADAAHVSRGYLNRLFRDTFDMSAAAALEQLRCARAENLLARTDLTIDGIARQCGFADVSHFSRRFTLLHGIPPSAYRVFATTSVLDHPGIRRLNHLVAETA